MFRTLIYPSSGACDYVDELPHRSSCSVKTDVLAEQGDRCGNSSTHSQAPEDGYINVRNMLST